MYEFLESKGVLDKGEAVIQATKIEYRRLYNRHLKRKLRETAMEFSPSFTKDELRILREKAEEHNCSITRLIHDSTLAYMKEQFLLPNREQVGKIELHLSKVYDEIKRLCARSSNQPRLQLLSLIRIVSELEKLVGDTLRDPLHLDEAIRRVIRKDPVQKKRLLDLVNQESP